MKKLKRFLASLMVVVMVLTAAPLSGFVGLELPNIFDIFASAESYSGTCGENLTWSLDTETGELVISGAGEMYNYRRNSNFGNYYAPWDEYDSSIKKVIIGDGVTSIGNYTFYSCTSLTSVTIPDGVISIGDYVFCNCDSLTSITIPDSVTSIGSSAFNDCTSLTSITIPDSVTSIGQSAFEGCTSLTSITIPDSVTSISNWVFSRCTSLTSVTIPDGVRYIGHSAFRGCTGLTSVIIGNGVTSIDDYAFYSCSGITELTMPISANIYSTYTFDGCTNIKKITLTKGNGTVQNYKYGEINCTNIRTPWYISDCSEIVIEDGITNIGSLTFYNCRALENVYYTGDVADWCTITFSDSNSNPMCYADNLYINGELLTELVIPDSVTSIKDYAFIGCTSLTNVTIPDNVTSIGEDAFGQCTGLTSVSVDEDNEQYSSDEFGNLYNKDKTQLIRYPAGNIRTSYTIPDSVTSIGDNAFSDCSILTSVTIPDSVTRIGYRAFYNCSGLTELTMPISAKIYNSEYTFGGCSNIEKITLTKGNGTVQDYCIDPYNYPTNTYYRYTPWYINGCAEIVIEDGVTGIGSYTFFDCSGLISVTIGNGVTSIGNYAFSECSGLISVTIGNGVTSIGDYAFSECSNLKDVIFKNNGYIELDELFLDYSPKAMICCEENSYLHTYAEANNIKFCLLDENGVPSFVVQNDVLLSYRGESTDVFISAGTKIGYGAFENNSIVETVVLSSSVSRIHANAFKNCASLTTVIIPESVTSIGAGAFDGCDNITIWCYAGSYADSYAKANGIDVEYIALDIEKDILILTLSGTSSLTASLNTPFVENAGVVWSSTNTSIATVDGNGNIKGIKAGTTVIVATSKEGGLRDYCVVKVVGIEALSTATIDHENGFIMGLSSNLDTLDSYVEISDPACNLSYDSLGTDSIVYVECDGEIVDAYSVIIFGDVNGDSWYDGQDAIIVDCLANGMLTKEDVSEAVYTAADCNHDGVIDQLDVDLLNEAGTLLSNVDQSKPAEVLLETSSEYVEYLDLIDQSPEIEIEDETDTPEADVETDDTTPEQDTKVDIFEMIMNFIRYIIEMILSRIPVPYR